METGGTRGRDTAGIQDKEALLRKAGTVAREKNARRKSLACVRGREWLFFRGGCEADIDGEGVGIDEAVDDAGDFLGVAGAGEFSAIVGGADEAEDVGLFAGGGDFERAMHMAEAQLNSIFFHADERDFHEGGFAIAADLVEGSDHVIAAGERPALVVDGLVGIDAEP